MSVLSVLVVSLAAIVCMYIAVCVEKWAVHMYVVVSKSPVVEIIGLLAVMVKLLSGLTLLVSVVYAATIAVTGAQFCV